MKFGAFRGSNDSLRWGTAPDLKSGQASLGSSPSQRCRQATPGCATLTVLKAA